MVTRKRIQSSQEGSINDKLDKLAENIKKLPDSRKEVLEKFMEKRLYDCTEACEILGISLAALRRLIKLERVKTIYIGRMLRIPADEIDLLMQGEESYFTTQEVAKLMNVGRETIVRLINSGKIKATRLSTKSPFKIPKTEVERIAKEGV